MKPKVINIKTAPMGWKTNVDYVYIGRAGKGEVGYFGNPFPLGSGVPGDTLPRYEEYLRQRLRKDADFALAFDKLEGKTLVCFCKPNPCHGDIMAKIWEERNEKEEDM